MAKVELKPINVVMAYNVWLDWDQQFYKQIGEVRDYYYRYTDHPDAPPGIRMSKRMAEAFADFLRNSIASGTAPVAPLTPRTVHLKGHSTVGIESTEMYESIEVFRTDLGGGTKRTGYVVGVKERGYGSSRGYPTYYRLSWLEFGTEKQVPRPIVASAYRQFLEGDNVNKLVQGILSRGLGMSLKG